MKHLSSTQLTDLIAAMESAASTQQAVYKTYDRKQNLERLERIRGSLQKIQRELLNLDTDDEMSLDQYLYLATRDQQFLAVHRDRENFHHLTEALQNGLEKMIDINASGKGRPKNDRYTFSVSQLMSAYESIFPKHALSSKANSPLHRVVSFYLSHVLRDENAEAAAYINHVKAYRNKIHS
jgi:exonuclease VII large subunit